MEIPRSDVVVHVLLWSNDGKDLHLHLEIPMGTTGRWRPAVLVARWAHALRVDVQQEARQGGSWLSREISAESDDSGEQRVLIDLAAAGSIRFACNELQWAE